MQYATHHCRAVLTQLTSGLRESLRIEGPVLSTGIGRDVLGLIKEHHLISDVDILHRLNQRYRLGTTLGEVRQILAELTEQGYIKHVPRTDSGNPGPNGFTLPSANNKPRYYQVKGQHNDS